jgi:hypothetical protein
MKTFGYLFLVLALSGCVATPASFWRPADIGAEKRKLLESGERYYVIDAGDKNEKYPVWRPLAWRKHAKSMLSFLGPDDCCWYGRNAYWGHFPFLYGTPYFNVQGSIRMTPLWLLEDREQLGHTLQIWERSIFAPSVDANNLEYALNGYCEAAERHARGFRQGNVFKVKIKEINISGMACVKRWKHESTILPSQGDRPFLGGSTRVDITCPVRLESEISEISISYSFYFYENAYKEGVVYLPENSPDAITQKIESSWQSLFNGGLQVHAPVTDFIEPSGRDGYHCVIDS